MGAHGWIAAAIFVLATIHASFVMVVYKQYRLERRLHGFEDNENQMTAADILGEP